MNSIYVLSQDFTIQGVIDEYVSIIWRPAYADIGDFEIFLGATPKSVTLLREGNYVVRSCDISVDNGITTYKKVMQIKNIQISTDVENGDYLTVTGRELKYLLHQRLVWGQTNLYGTVEDCIERLIDENAINPWESSRIIPTLRFIKTDLGGVIMRKQITAKPLDESIVEICNTYGYGWDLYITDNKLTACIYTGADRSYDQRERPYVVFSDEFDNLYNTEYQLNTESYANVALVGGEGEGLDRIYSIVNGEVTGLDRFETFVDAANVSRNREETLTGVDSITATEIEGVVGE